MDENSKVYAIPSQVESQSSYFRSGVTKNISTRIRLLDALEEALISSESELIEALQADFGKPPIESYLTEIHFLITEIRLVKRNLRRWCRPERAGSPFYFLPARSEIRREPLGTTLIVSPWNYPLQLSLAPAISAIAAGNVVILKPSEMAPRTANAMATMIAKVFHPNHFTVIEGGPEVGQALLEQSFQCWFYTGSERIGRLYAEAAARSLAPITLELGGKCPCIVADDVDLKTTVERIVAGKFLNGGQTCIAPDFILLPKELQENFAKLAEERLRRAYPEPCTTDLARIISESHFDRISRLIPESAVRLGSDDRQARYLAPTLIPNADWESPCMQEEIFGPILPLVPYENLYQAVSYLANKTSHLALYIFSKNKETFETIASQVPSGSACHNDVLKQATNLNLPFGGVGSSGMGRYRGEAGFRNFTYERAVTRRWFFPDPFAVTPPYDGQFEKMKKILK
ncbi:MAG: aldehyde dehydrogenase family protein [Verrucomicrobiota bacterium]